MNNEQLNKLMAEKVMGYKYEPETKTMNAVWIGNDGSMRCADIYEWNPAKDERHANMVLQTLAGLGYTVTIKLEGGLVYCDVVSPDHQHRFGVQTDRLALAICEVAKNILDTNGTI